MTHKTYDVDVLIKPQNVLPDLFDWLNENSLFFREHWDYSKTSSIGRDYTFHFDRSEDATVFALKWA